MSNYNFVFPYKNQIETDLAELGLPHPRVNPGNRFPTKQEVIDGIINSGFLRAESADESTFFAVKVANNATGEYAIRIDCSDWDRLGTSETDSITMKGCFDIELALLEILSHQCGQLLLHPDTGTPPVIVQPGMDVPKVFALWERSCEEEDSWGYFYSHLEY